MMHTSTRRTIRPLRATLAMALVAAGLMVGGPAAPAGAAPSTPFFGLDSPLEYGGTDYVDPPPSFSGDGALFVAGNGEAVFTEHNPGALAPDISGDSDINLGLVAMTFPSGVANISLHVADSLFDDAPGAPYTRDCAGFDALWEAIGPDGLIDSDCQAFKEGYFTANGPGADFDFHGYGDFIDSLGDPVASSPDRSGANGDNYADAGLVVVRYQASSSPLTFDGTDYDDDFIGGSGSGALWLPLGTAPFLVASTPSPLPLLPMTGPGGEIASVHIMLVQAGAAASTIFVDGALFTAFGPPGFSTDCPGFNDFLDMVGAGFIECVAFLADVFSAPAALGESFTCNDIDGTWTDENGAAIAGELPTVVEGFDAPALTPYGTTGDDPGVCVLAETVEPPTTTPPATTPPSSQPNQPTSPAPTNPFTAPSTRSSAPSQLPATGSTSLPIVVAAMLALGLGVAAIGVRRRLVVAEADDTEPRRP